MTGGVTGGNRADPRGYMGMCGSVADMCSMARVVRSGHGMAMCRYWTHRRVPRGDVPGLWLIDEDVDLLRVGVCEILTHDSIGLIGNPYQQVATSFPEAHLKRTLRLSVLGLEQF